MSRRLRIFAIRILTIMMLAAAMPVGWLTALAGTAKISFSDPSPGVGEEFTVSVKINSADGTLGGADVMLSYDPNSIQFVGGSNASGGAGSVHLVGMMNSDTNNSFSFNLKFKALQAGDSKINVSDSEIYDVNTQPVTVSQTGSSTVKVKAPSTYSKEASLASLKVSPGTLEPAFSPKVTSYKVSVGSDVSKLAVSAAPKDSKAKVVVSDCKLKVGENKIVCKVTAEDGQTVHTYTLKVDRAEPSETEEESSAGTQEAVNSDQKVTVGKTEYTVAKSFDASILPQGFTSSSCSYNGSDVMCGIGNGLTLIYLQDSAGTGGFYIYEPDSGTLSAYEVIHQPNSSIIVLPPDDSLQIPDGFAKTSILLGDGREITAWVARPDAASAGADPAAAGSGESSAAASADTSGESAGTDAQNESDAADAPQDGSGNGAGADSYLVYGMNEQGEKGLYRYDAREQTFQRYIADPVQKSSYSDDDVKNLNDRFNSLLKDYNIRFFVMVGLVVLCLILFFIIINMLLKHRDHRDGGPGGGFRGESETPVKRRIRQEQEQQRQRPLKERTGRQEDDFYREPGARPSRPETLRLYREEPQKGAARVAKPVQSHERGGRREADRPERYDPLERYDRSEHLDRPQRYDRPEHTGRPERGERSKRQERSRRPEAEPQRYYRDYDFHQETGRQDARRPETQRSRQDISMEEIMRQRELEREERSRQARERLERERREDERRAKGERPGVSGVRSGAPGARPDLRRSPQAPARTQNRRRPEGRDDDFENPDY